jgi:hypothetical protein
MARGAETALLAREGEQVLVPALGASDTGEAMGQNPAALEALQGAGDDTPERAIPGRVAVVIQVEEGLGVVRDQLPERRGLGFTGAIGRRALGGSPSVRGLPREDGEGAGH